MGAQPCTLTHGLSHTLMLNKLFLEQEQEFSLLLCSEPQFLLHHPLWPVGNSPSLWEKELSLNSFNLGLPHPAATTDLSPGKGHSPCQPQSVHSSPCHAHTACPVFPCLELPSVPACPALQTGGVCSHLCSHTAPFTRRHTGI